MRTLSLRMSCLMLRVGLPLTLILALLALAGAGPGVALAQQKGQDKKEPPDKAAPKTGLLVNEPTASKGYTLIAPINSTNTYLVDMEGHVMQSWKSD